MRTILIAFLALLIAGCSSRSGEESSTVGSQGERETRSEISIVPVVYRGLKAKNVPLGKCIVAPIPPPTETVDVAQLLDRALREPPVLRPDDALAVYLTPKRMLTELDFVQANKFSRWDGSTVHISFGFVEYAGDIKDLPGPMACVVQCFLGKLPAGRYRVRVMNGYFQYLEVGKENEARPVPKTRIHPDIFWHDIEFVVKNR